MKLKKKTGPKPGKKKAPQWTIRYTGGCGTFILRNPKTLEEMYLDAPCRGDSEKLALQFLASIKAKKVKVLP